MHDLIVWGSGRALETTFVRADLPSRPSRLYPTVLGRLQQSLHATSAATTHWTRHLSCEPTPEYFHRTVLIHESIPEP